MKKINNIIIILAALIGAAAVVSFFSCASGGESVVLNAAAPDFCLPDQNGTETCLKDYTEKWVVLYFYPKDNSPGCTIQAVEYTRLLPEFTALNTTVFGISNDNLESHCDFIADHNLTLTLLSDQDKTVMNLYDSAGIFSRNTFLINPEGILVKKWLGVNPSQDPGIVLDAINELSGKSQS